jgi:hypothetical protein
MLESKALRQLYGLLNKLPVVLVHKGDIPTIKRSYFVLVLLKTPLQLAQQAQQRAERSIALFFFYSHHVLLEQSELEETQTGKFRHNTEGRDKEKSSYGHSLKQNRKGRGTTGPFHFLRLFFLPDKHQSDTYVAEIPLLYAYT